MRRQHLHLTDLCHDLINIPDQTGAIMVTGLAVDSKRVAAGNLFFALAGSHRDGRDFIGDAIKAGAVAIVTGMAHWQKILPSWRNRRQFQSCNAKTHAASWPKWLQFIGRHNLAWLPLLPAQMAKHLPPNFYASYGNAPHGRPLRLARLASPAPI